MKPDWIPKKLGDVMSLEYGKPLPKDKRRADSKYPAYGANGIKCLADEPFWTEPSIIVGRKGTAGAVKLVDGGFWPLDVTYYVTFEKNNYDRKYLFYLLSSLNLPALAKGVKPGINRNDVYAIERPFPSLPEQKRIVAILDEVFAGIETAIANTEKNLANARELFESELSIAVDEAVNIHGCLPLSGLATDITDGDHMPPPKTANGIPFITIKNIDKQTRKIDFSETFQVPEEYYERLKENRRPQPGDVLYTVTGSYGIPVLVDEGRKFCFQRHIGLIRPKNEVSSRWLEYILLSPQVMKQANDGATGTAQKTVSLKLLRNLKVPKQNKRNQDRFVSRMDALSSDVQRLSSVYRQKLAAFAELKQSLLQKAFSGELTADKAEDEVQEAVA